MDNEERNDMVEAIKADIKKAHEGICKKVVAGRLYDARDYNVDTVVYWSEWCVGVTFVKNGEALAVLSTSIPDGFDGDPDDLAISGDTQSGLVKLNKAQEKLREAIVDLYRAGLLD